MEPQPNTTDAPGFRVTLPSEAGNVAIVRQALAGAAEAVGVDEARLLDINAAVSEACNNVVVHAYPDAIGPMVVRLRIEATEVEAIVTDRGVGIRPHRPSLELELEGLGLSLIQTLTDRVELLGGAGEGTQVQMAFRLDSEHPDSPAAESAPSEVDVDPPSGELRIAVSPGPLAAAVLGRVISMLAARAGFSLEGISDAQLVTDSLAARIPAVSPGEAVRVGVDLPEQGLSLRVGPLIDGGSDRLLAGSTADGLPPVLERLTEGRRVERGEGGETLRFDLVSRR